MAMITIKIDGITDPQSERYVEEVLSTLPRVAWSKADRSNGLVVIDYINGPPEIPALADALHRAGFTLSH